MRTDVNQHNAGTAPATVNELMFCIRHYAVWHGKAQNQEKQLPLISPETGQKQYLGIAEGDTRHRIHTGMKSCPVPLLFLRKLFITR